MTYISSELSNDMLGTTNSRGNEKIETTITKKLQFLYERNRSARVDDELLFLHKKMYNMVLKNRVKYYSYVTY